MLRVQVPGVRLRTQPTSESEVLQTLPGGASLRALGGQELAEGFDWYEVAIGDHVGWVAAGEDGEWLAAVRNGRIAFGCTTCGTNEDGRATATVESDGSGLEMILPSFGFARWSPDGSQAVIEDAEASTEWPQLHLQDGAGEPRLLGEGAGAAWSPDGTRLAYLRSDGSLMLHGVLEEPIGLSVLDHGALGSLTWSPDSTQLAFLGVDCPDCPIDQPIMGDPPIGVFVVEPPGGSVDRLAGIAPSSGLQWLTDGSGLTFVETDYETITSRLMLVELGVDGARVLHERPGFNFGHAVSPDGTRAVVGSSDGISVSNSDGSDARVVVPATEASNPSPRNPRWSPDGEWILYDMVWVTGDLVDAWIVRADGRGARQVRSDAYEASWQPRLEPLGDDGH
jgi:Bacterial SH3 domain/WD40-like Beta Propeller Repeat